MAVRHWLGSDLIMVMIMDHNEMTMMMIITMIMMTPVMMVMMVENLLGDVFARSAGHAQLTCCSTSQP